MAANDTTVGLSEPLERKHWKHLYSEIVATEICTACSACVVACPHHMIEMRDFRPHQIVEEEGPSYCEHGEKSCSLCAMACLRLDADFDAIEATLFGRRRKHPSEPWGITRKMMIGRATSPEILARCQDGGVVTAIVGWMLSTGEIDGATCARPRADLPWLDEPFVATTPEELAQASGSRYTYCSSPLALKLAAEKKLKKVAAIGVSCETTAVREMAIEGIKRWSRMTKFVVGLMCNETFQYEPFINEIVQGRYGIDIGQVTKINVKGDVFVTQKDGTDTRIPLKECQEHVNEWCHHCPDFSAEHADLSCGGIGLKGWTMSLIRTEYGEDVWNRALAAGVIEARPAEEDPDGLRALERLAKKQRFRVGPFESHAAARWPVREVLARVRREALEEALAGNGQVEPAAQPAAD
jgi:coenzyme F420 hydrogenase subunit beta